MLATLSYAIDGRGLGLNRIKYIFLCLIRLILVVAAPRFAFFLASRHCPQSAMKIGPHSTPFDEIGTHE